MTDEVILKRSFGATLRHFRAERQLTQQQLADHAGVFRTYLADVERGQRNLALTSMCRLIGALEVPPSAFFETMEEIAAADDNGHAS